MHVVERVETYDHISRNRFVTRYAYHHGYFDGDEREFRGFGMVEQLDTEDFGTFAAGNADSPYITDDQTLYQPPVKTMTWFHTGAFLDRERMLSAVRARVLPDWLATSRRVLRELGASPRKPRCPQPDLVADGPHADEWREALRACKGMMLRQEVYELDVDALRDGAEQRRCKLFSAAEHNCHIRACSREAATATRSSSSPRARRSATTTSCDLRRPRELKPDPRDRSHARI